VYHGGSRANDTDHKAAIAVQQSAATGTRVTLPSHQASHIRDGAEWFAAHKSDFSPAVVKQVSSLYANVYDQHGRKVVDRRSFRM
jgi:hypothetical protein